MASSNNTLFRAIEIRRGTLHDLHSLRFEDVLSISAESIEFNVLGVGHEFWIAAQSGSIIGVTVLAKEDADNLRILHLEVAPARKNEGFGSALVKAILSYYPRCGISVVPFEGTDEFYSHLGFSRVSRWEMKREPSA